MWRRCCTVSALGWTRSRICCSGCVPWMKTTWWPKSTVPCLWRGSAPTPGRCWSPTTYRRYSALRWRPLIRLGKEKAHQAKTRLGPRQKLFGRRRGAGPQRRSSPVTAMPPHWRTGRTLSGGRLRISFPGAMVPHTRGQRHCCSIWPSDPGRVEIGQGSPGSWLLSAPGTSGNANSWSGRMPPTLAVPGSSLPASGP